MNTVEIMALDVRHELLRAKQPAQEKNLLSSLSESGQQNPVVVVREEGRFVVIDGHKRVRALKKLKAETVRAVVWEMDQAEALAASYGLNAASPRSAFEDGWLIETLHHRFNWSLGQIGKRLLRSTSWVSRRMSLVEEAPAWLAERVQAGRIGAHAAAHYLLPLTRGNTPEAKTLLDKLAALELTDRQIKEVAEGYRRGTSEVRQKIAESPALFLKARCALQTPAVFTDIESRCVRNLTILGNIALGLVKALPEALPTETPGAARVAIRSAWVLCEERWAMLQKTVAAVIPEGGIHAG